MPELVLVDGRNIDRVAESILKFDPSPDPLAITFIGGQVWDVVVRFHNEDFHVTRSIVMAMLL